MSSHGQSRLVNGAELHVGQHLVSPNEQFYLTMQADGHLAIYETVNSYKPPVWKSTINSKVLDVEGPFTFKMQEDNNAVVYDRKGKSIWCAGTYEPDLAGLFHLDMDDDGNFYIRNQDNKVLWTSHTAIQRFSEGKEGMSVLDQGQELHTGQYLVSSNEQFYLTMQSDGYLAIYGKDKSDVPLWKSTINPSVSNVEGPFIFKMQEDNNTVVYDGSGQPIWHTDTSTDNCICRLTLDDDGDLFVHGKHDTNWRIWSTKNQFHQSSSCCGWYEQH